MRAAGSAGPAPSDLRIAQLDDVAVDGLPTPCRSGVGQISARRAACATGAHRAVRDALLHRRHHRGRRRADRAACRTRHRHARRALAALSRTVISPMGLSSLTTSPVSVTHDVRAQAGKLHVHPEGGHPTPLTETTSRGPTSSTTGHCCSVAGSKSAHRWRVPATRPARSETAAQVQRQDGRFGQLAHLARRAAGSRHAERESMARRPHRGRRGPRSGIEKNVERPHGEGAIDMSGRANTHAAPPHRTASSAGARPPAARSRRLLDRPGRP